MKRRQTLALGAAAGAALAPPRLAGADSAAGQRVDQGTQLLRVRRYAYPIAETGFDPAQISDTCSRNVTSHIFEAHGFRRPPFWNGWWHWIDVDPARRGA